MPAGGRVLIDGQWREPGLYGREVYPAGIDLALPQPPRHPRDPFAAGREVLTLFERCYWRRAIDPRLALGALACLIAGGPLTWRPILAINGENRRRKITAVQLLGGAWSRVGGDDPGYDRSRHPRHTWL